MGFFSGSNCMVVPGFKELTKDKPIGEFTTPKMVAIALKSMGSEAFEIHVQVGDYVKIGTKLATRNDHFHLPLYSSVSGTVTAIEKRDHTSLKKTTHIVVENDFADTKERLFNPVENIFALEQAEIVEYIKNIGAVGLGGAGFPTYVKFLKVDGIHTVLLNGIECEPYITVDDFYIKKDHELLVEGLILSMKASGAKKGVIGIKEGKPELYEILVNETKKHSSYDLEIKQMRNVYPMGWERFFIKEAFGKEYDRLPGEIGIITMNTSTVIEFVRSMKTGYSMYERMSTLSGDGFKNPQNIRVRVGTILADAIEAIGGYTEGVPKNCRLIAGGPFMGASCINDSVSINASGNAFLCLMNTEVEPSPCLRCGKCIENCPAGLQPVQIVQANASKNTKLLRKLHADRCIVCGTCTYTCPSALDVTDATSKAKTFIMSQK